MTRKNFLYGMETLPTLPFRMRSFDVVFIISQIKLLNKESRCRWFETPWRFCDMVIIDSNIRRNLHIDGLMQERRNSIANALELRLSCTNPSRCAKLAWCTTDATAAFARCATMYRRHVVDVRTTMCINLNTGQPRWLCLLYVSVAFSSHTRDIVQAVELGSGTSVILNTVRCR